MKRLFLIAVLFVALICPNWTMAQPPIPRPKPSLLVPKIVVRSDRQISDAVVTAMRQTFVKELAFTDLYYIVDAETEASCREYCKQQPISLEDNLKLGRKLGTSYILLVQLNVNPSSNEMLISAQIANLRVYDDYRRAEIKCAANAQDMIDACKRLVKQMCPDSAKPDFYVKVEEMPTFQEGDIIAFQSWLHERLRYPQAAQERGISGVVLVSFIVETDGSMSEITVMRSPDQSLSDEVLRLFNLAPKWQPGKHYGEAVRVKYSIPIMFRLNK